MQLDHPNLNAVRYSQSPTYNGFNLGNLIRKCMSYLYRLHMPYDVKWYLQMGYKVWLFRKLLNVIIHSLQGKEDGVQVNFLPNF